MFGRVIGVGRSHADLDEGLTRGAIDEATNDPVAAVTGADLVVLGVPVASMTSTVRAMLPALGADAIVTDVGGVKAPLVAELDELLAGHARFVAAIPSREPSAPGMAAAFADLFQGRCCVLTPTPRTDPTALATVRSLWEGRRDAGGRHGRRSPRSGPGHGQPPPARGRVALAGEIEACEAAGEELVPFSAGELKDFTRIAASDPALWRDIFTMNRDEVAAGIRGFRERLERLEGSDPRRARGRAARGAAGARSLAAAAASNRDRTPRPGDGCASRAPRGALASASIAWRTTMAISQDLLDILACPKCKGEVELNASQDGLVCAACKLVYEMRGRRPSC